MDLWSKNIRNMKYFLLLGILVPVASGCEKTGTVPIVAKPAAFTVVNVIPNSAPVIPVINTTSAALSDYFWNANAIGYGNFYEYSPPGGNDTIYVVQQNSDTMDIGPKDAGLMFYNILDLKAGGIYSLFLTGADTSSPDYLLTTDSLPYQSPTDSTVGIRFVNLSAGSNPISINLEGSPNGSAVGNLAYKNITSFKNYVSNSTVTNSGYLFVIRDVASGDSLTSYLVPGIGTGNGVGLMDPTNSNPLVFRNVTIAVYGSENGTTTPLMTMLVDNY